MTYTIVFSDFIKVFSLYSMEACSLNTEHLLIYIRSLNKGSLFKIRLCMETRSWSIVEVPGTHIWSMSPVVLGRLKQTSPHINRFGFIKRPPER